MRKLCAIFLLLLVCAACGPGRGKVIESVGDLITALHRAGARTEMLGAKEDSTFGVPGQVLRVGAAEVVAYEYPNEEERAAVSDTITTDGLSIRGVRVSWMDRPNLWASGHIILLYVGTDGGTIVLLSGLLGDPLTVRVPTIDEPYPPAVTAAIDSLARALAIDPGTIDVLSFTSVDWPDSCLGIPALQEVCSLVITPGWQVILQANGSEYEFHTDLIGHDIRQVTAGVP